jgi:uncharacterized protein YdaU (DUF1376 family)
MSPNAWSIAQALLKNFFVKNDDGLLHHGRIDTEIAKAQLNYEAAIIKAKLAAGTRWGKNAPSIPSSNAPSTP